MSERRPGGILRRDPVPFQYRETPDNELLVFGYQCKLYRDDSKALFIDQGRHLIPCPSNTSLKVDRFDVRGALSDPVQFEPPPGGYSDRLEGLTPAERKAEELCEEERYYDLFHNDVDEELYQDQDSNSGSNGAKIGFNYDGDGTPGPKGPDDEESQDGLDFEPFVPPEGFYIPPKMEVPENMKQHAVIEKTAKFISSQGIQMEILLKAKQSNNPQFSFLIHDDRLWPYYKHVLEAIKTKVYPVIEKEPAKEKDSENAASPFEAVGPIVNMEQITSFEQNSVPVPNYIPSQDCVYFKLMNSIGKVSGIKIQPKPVPETKPEQVNGDKTQQNTTITSGLQGLVAYASDSDESDEEEEPNSKETYTGPIPPSEIQNIIEKVASYVAKNGDEFEEIMANRTKDDPRFSFLAKDNEFHGYYLHKLEILAPHIVKARSIKAKLASKVAINNNPPAPVSFSIKPKEDPSPAVINAKPVLLQENSDNNSEDGENEHQVKPSSQITTLPGNILLTSELKEKMKEARRAKEQIQNKLALAARERLAGPTSKEEQLRHERKLKAKAFLDKIQKPTMSNNKNPQMIGPQPVPTPPKIGPIPKYVESDQESIHSLPDSVSNTIEILSSGSESHRSHTPEISSSRHGERSSKKHRKKEKKEKKSKKSKRKRYSRSRSSDSSDPGGGRSRSRKYKRSRTRSRSSDRRYRRRS